MKKHIILEGMGIEFGPGNKIVAVHEFQNTSLKNLGMQDKKIPFSQLPPQKKDEVKRIVGYINKHNLAKKVTGKEDYSSLDLTFKADGSAIINFDDGGSVRVPQVASIMTEAETFALKGPNKNLLGGADGRRLGVEFVPIDQIKNDNPYGVKSVWAIGHRYEDRVKIASYTELEDYQKDAIRSVFQFLQHQKSNKDPNVSALDYVNKKEDWKSVDVVFMGDGSADVQFDNSNSPIRINYSKYSKMKGWNPNLSKKENQEKFRSQKSVVSENFFPY